MKLNSSQVDHVARLAKLPLSSSEKKQFSSQLSNILDYISKLNTVQTKNVEPTFNVTGLVNIEGPDQAKPCLTVQEVLQNTTSKKDDYFVSQGVFEDE